MQHPPAKSRPVFLLIFVLSVGFAVAWQNPPPLSLTATVEPAMASSGQVVTVTFTITNTGDTSLEEVEITATVPQGTAFERAAADPAHAGQPWEIDLSEDVIRYRATGPFPAGASAQVALVVTVLSEAGEPIVFGTYEATADGLERPVPGEPITIQVETTPTPVAPTATPTATQTSTMVATETTTPTPTATATPEPSPTTTPQPTPTLTPRPTPTPTITVVVAELPPTPTPNLSTEQEIVGTVTVMIFVIIVVAVIVAAVVWVIRTARGG